MTRRRPSFRWSVVFACGIATLLLIRFLGGDTSPNISHLELLKGHSGNVLVIVLHAFTNTRDDMQDIIDTTQEILPHADVLAPNYHAGTFANTSLIRTAAQLDLDIQRIVDRKKQTGAGYEEIVLVGHSIGALLVRKAYLYSKGIASDHPYSSRMKSTEWHENVKRIILLAGINRGWSTENMGTARKVQVFIGRVLAKITGLGQMVLSTERGAPFVTDLKVDWIRSSNSDQIAADIIQILGKEDTTAPIEEHKELMATPNFIFIPLLEGATHANVIDLRQDRKEGEVDDRFRDIRKEAFIEAMQTPVNELEVKYGANDSYLDDQEPFRRTIQHVVFVMHGIRDDGNWLDSLGKRLEDAGPGIKAITSEYGYFPMARFLLFGDREKNVRWFVDQYSEALALYPNATKFSFVGHSNGTYLLASALENYQALRFNRVYFSGSVVRSNFPWNNFVYKTERVGYFRNDISVDDWVVALFPKFYQLVSQQFGYGDRGFFNLGSGGFNGFLDQAGKQNVRFVHGGHGGALATDHFPSIVEYIAGENTPIDSYHHEDVDNRLRDISSSFLGFTSNIAWIIWLLLMSLVGSSGYLFVRVFRKRLSRNGAIALYVGVILAVLYSI